LGHLDPRVSLHTMPAWGALFLPGRSPSDVFGMSPNMRYMLYFAACLVISIASASNTVRNWQDGTLVSAEAYKEAPAPSDAVAVTESSAPGRVMINRALEKLIGLPGQRSWSNFWGYVIDTQTRRYIAISKHAVNIAVDGT